ncbi:MAG: outer membrane lipoprotein carrier protein LolA [Maricaulaceae bacterium]
MTKFILPAALAALCLALANAPSVAQTAEPEATPAADEHAADEHAAEIERINAYVRGLDTIEGRFLQTASNGQVDEGAFYWRRPDRQRNEYETNPLVVVADGGNIAQINRDLETVDQSPIRLTPFKFLLDRRFDLNEGAEVVELQTRGSEVLVTVRDKEGEVDGDFTLVFAYPALEFRGWRWRTAHDGGVDFYLTNLQRGGRLDPRLFIIEDSTGDRDDRRRR